jgi:small subunit ribosomal protein S20
LAHSKSAKKRIRQNQDARTRNRSAKAALRTTIKKFNAAVESGDDSAAQAAFKAVQKNIDKTASKRILPKGRAARVKSRLSTKLKSAKKA